MNLSKALFPLMSILVMLVIVLVFTSCSRNLEALTQPLNMSEGIVAGDNSAPLQVVEYSSFQCPECRKLHQNIQTTLQQYINEKKIFYVFKPVDVERFQYDQYVYAHLPVNSENFDTIKMIFEKQDQWSTAKTEEEVKRILGLEDIEGNIAEKRKETMNHIKTELKDREIVNVPTFYINGKKFVGVYSKQDFEKLLEDEK